MGRFKICFIAVSLLTLVGCGDIAIQPSPLGPDTGSGATYVLAGPAGAAPMGGLPRQLAGGSKWVLVGAIAQGTVFRPQGGILTAEGTHVHEAYLVVRDGVWVGFWMPFEKAFSPAQSASPISLRQE